MQKEIKEAIENGKLIGEYYIAGNRIQNVNSLKVTDTVKLIGGSCSSGHFRICAFYFRVFADVNDPDKTFTKYTNVDIPESKHGKRTRTTIIVTPTTIDGGMDYKNYQNNEIIIKPECAVPNDDANIRNVVNVTLKIYKLNKSEEAPTKEETTMKPEMKEKDGTR